MRKEQQENVKRMKYNAKLKEKLQKWEQLKVDKQYEKPKTIETERKKKNSKTSHTHNRSFFKHRQTSQNNKIIKKRFASLAKPIIANNYNISDIYQDQNYINIRTDFVDYKTAKNRPETLHTFTKFPIIYNRKPPGTSVNNRTAHSFFPNSSHLNGALFGNNLNTKAAQRIYTGINMSGCKPARFKERGERKLKTSGYRNNAQTEFRF